MRSKSDNAYLHKMFGYMNQECCKLNIDYDKKNLQSLLQLSAALLNDPYYDMTNVDYAFDALEYYLKLNEEYASCYLEYCMMCSKAAWIDDPEGSHDRWIAKGRLRRMKIKQTDLIVEIVRRFIELLPMFEVMIPLMNFIKLDYNVGEIVTKYYANIEDETMLVVIKEFNILQLALVVLKYFRKMKFIPMELYMNLKKTCLRVMKLLYPDQVGSFYSLVSIVGFFVGVDVVNKHVVPYCLAYLPAVNLRK